MADVARENPNGASYLFLTDGVGLSSVDRLERCFDLLDGKGPQAVEAIRDRWRALLEDGCTPT